MSNLLEGGKQFQIPLFQRPYAWEKRKLGNFVGRFNEPLQ
jgi:uncharacterized protein with ParB-like and HNH nuclease domain